MDMNSNDSIQAHISVDDVAWRRVTYLVIGA